MITSILKVFLYIFKKIMCIFLFFLFLIKITFVHLRMFNSKPNKMNTFNKKQKVTIIVFLILGTILIANQIINNFNFVL